MVHQTDEFFYPLGLCQTYHRAFVMLCRHLGSLSCLFLCILIPMIVVMLTAGLYGGANGTTQENDFGVFVGAMVAEMILYILFALVAKGSMMRVVAEGYTGYFPSGWSCVKKTFSRLCTLLSFGLVVGIVFFLSTMLPVGLGYLYTNTGSKAWLILGIVVTVICGLWLIYFSVSIVCAMPAIMVESDLSAIGAMARAHSLSVGYFCYVFGVMFIVLIPTIIILLLGPLGHIANIILVPFHAM